MKISKKELETITREAITKPLGAGEDKLKILVDYMYRHDIQIYKMWQKELLKNNRDIQNLSF
jgi:hypothetical protein